MKYSKAHYKQFNINCYTWMFYSNGRHYFRNIVINRGFDCTEEDLVNGNAFYVAGDYETGRLLGNIYRKVHANDAK